jgi:hypothetical protein
MRAALFFAMCSAPGVSRAADPRRAVVESLRGH